MHSTEGHGEAQAAPSELQRLGPEKGTRGALRRARVRRQFEIIRHSLEDIHDDHEALGKSIAGLLALVNDLQRLSNDCEEPFGPEWP